ncbi:hypothetical protein K438DRAFT_1764776 [Mycena galopus ATCC 62051]|nr:hypothetical protein K438DRAFT_1764776 [Mycena galopus ATCC 62051]
MVHKISVAFILAASVFASAHGSLLENLEERQACVPVSESCFGGKTCCTGLTCSTTDAASGAVLDSFAALRLRPVVPAFQPDARAARIGRAAADSVARMFVEYAWRKIDGSNYNAKLVENVK